MSQFDDVIREFQQRRLEKELTTQQIRYERLQQLREMAHVADMEMRRRKSRKRSTQSY